MHKPPTASVGSLLRTLLEALDGDIAAIYAARGLPDYRPRYSPIVRALASDGPLPIRALALATGVTHSAASQTVAQLQRHGLAATTPGADARERIVRLTPRAHEMLPLIEAEWAATSAAMRELDAELPMPLGDTLAAAARALQRRPLRERVADSGLLDAETSHTAPPDGPDTR